MLERERRSLAWHYSPSDPGRDCLALKLPAGLVTSKLIGGETTNFIIKRVLLFAPCFLDRLYARTHSKCSGSSFETRYPCVCGVEQSANCSRHSRWQNSGNALEVHRRRAWSLHFWISVMFPLFVVKGGVYFILFHVMLAVCLNHRTDTLPQFVAIIVCPFWSPLIHGTSFRNGCSPQVSTSNVPYKGWKTRQAYIACSVTAG